MLVDGNGKDFMVNIFQNHSFDNSLFSSQSSPKSNHYSESVESHTVNGKTTGFKIINDNGKISKFILN